MQAQTVCERPPSGVPRRAVAAAPALRADPVWQALETAIAQRWPQLAICMVSAARDELGRLVRARVCALTRDDATLLWPAFEARIAYRHVGDKQPEVAAFEGGSAHVGRPCHRFALAL